MRYTFLLIILCLFSCNNERVLHLPEIENAEVTEVLDVSPAYIFYDDTQPDSTLLNRKNLITTTNWLVNVDKRLTLRQVIPHIKFLQDKKRNSELHKNEDAKNYFTCNDTSIGDLGFLEFTDVHYIEETPYSFYKIRSQLYFDRIFISPEIKSEDKIHTWSRNGDNLELKIISYSDFKNHIESTQNNNSTDFLIVQLNFDKNISFQDYTRFKSIILDINIEGVRFDTNEFIY